MAFNISFMANQTVTDEDINAIGYNLTNTVYTAFTNDTLYGVDELNAITSHMMSKGVKRNYKNECALTLEDTNVHIDSGLAFFENGATITIDDDGIDLTLEESTETQYVYLFFNDTINVGGARCTAEYPSGDFVMLGSVTDGVLTQDRTFAFLNADAKGTNEVVTLTLEWGTATDENGAYWMRYKTDINVTGFKKLCFYTPQEYVMYSSSDVTYVNKFAGIYDIENDSLVSASYYGYTNWGGKTALGVWNESNAYYKWYIEDGKFIMDFTNNNIAYFNTYNPPPLTVELYGGAEE